MADFEAPIEEGSTGPTMGAVFAASKFIAKAHRNRRYAKIG